MVVRSETTGLRTFRLLPQVQTPQAVATHAPSPIPGSRCCRTVLARSSASRRRRTSCASARFVIVGEAVQLGHRRPAASRSRHSGRQSCASAMATARIVSPDARAERASEEVTRHHPASRPRCHARPTRASSPGRTSPCGWRRARAAPASCGPPVACVSAAAPEHGSPGGW